jgi:hypothetical protein
MSKLAEFIHYYKIHQIRQYGQKQKLINAAFHSREYLVSLKRESINVEKTSIDTCKYC